MNALERARELLASLVERPPSEEERVDWVFALLDVIGDLLGERNGAHGMPLGGLVLAPPVVGATRDPDLSRHLESNSYDMGGFGDIYVSELSDESVVAHRLIDEDGGFMVRDRTPRWTSAGEYVRTEVGERGGKVVDILERRVPPPELERLTILLETTRVRHQATFARSERTARENLETYLSPEQREWYEVDGSFFEKSSRSGISYLLRKNRPTLALRIEDKTVRPLCALCLHPFGYYDRTWAGVLPPSDEVLAHLLYIRGDESTFWKKANHIPIDTPTSGV